MNDVSTPASKAVTKAPATATDLSPMNWIRGEIDRLFEDFGRPTRSMFFNAPAAVTAAPVPAMELSEGEKEYRLTAELPGLGQKDVDINVAEGVLTISGEKKEESERKEKGYLLSERRYGSFRREIALPSDVDQDAIKATFKDGVLTVVLAKDARAAPRARKISIES